MTIATLLAGVLVAGLLLPYSLGLGLASNKITNALAATPDNPLNAPFPQRSTVTDNRGNPIAYVYNQNRVVVPDEEISQNLKVAITTVEDKRFIYHHGVDWRGTVRALLSNASAGGGQQGGSTLTQQYVKNYLFLVQAKTDAQRADAIASTPGRKLREAKLALTLEQKETKQDILDGYLNLVAFLPSTYGAEATAQRLFRTSAANLTVPQAALMAGMVNNPNKYDPTNPDHRGDALLRRNLVLKLLSQSGSITAAQYKTYSATDLGIDNGSSIRSGCVPAQGAATNGYFCQYALDYLANAGLTSDQIANGGYTIKTTLDPAVMKQAHQAAIDQVSPTANPRIANVLAVVKPDSSRQVLALTANRPYGLDATRGQTVQKLPTTFAPLGAGSTFKIFTAAAAMTAGLGTSSVIQNPDPYTSTISPAHPFHNNTDFGEKFAPTVTLGDAMATSPNTAFVKLEDDLGLANVIDMAVALGMKGYSLNAGAVDPAFTGSTNTYAQELVTQKVASFTLGVTPVSPLELANVGATLSADGLWCPPTPIGNVADRNGKVVTLKAAAPCVQAVTKGVANALTAAMGSDIDSTKGTAHQSAVAAKWDLTQGTSAGKTGTTGDYKSSAFLGYSPSYSTSTLTWDYLPKPQSICTNAPQPTNPAATPLSLTGSCPLAQAKSAEANPKAQIAGMSGGSVPAATWFEAMKGIQPTSLLFPPADDPNALQGNPDTIVPDVTTGSPTVDAAISTLTSAGFKPVTKIDSTGTSAPINTVTRQDPPAGQSALPGSTVTISISPGRSSSGG
ncbi:penicillin-binding protein [Nakamurella sp. PAMC28650]|uniref:penicillin-binding protein n=1 Tax=Nakamurella sp. PAMC28650 TaxID=2762325 RepID=UPI00164DE323|nr:penicillin-binding protein [Nakamurella sp. PAMC28650]QNK82543.1 transglycosylase domain-containing protein [Nakamurella sp. PAMC28650]